MRISEESLVLAAIGIGIGLYNLNQPKNPPVLQTQTLQVMPPPPPGPHAVTHRAGGADDLLSSPGPIGGTTPSAGTFSSLTATLGGGGIALLGGPLLVDFTASSHVKGTGLLELGGTSGIDFEAGAGNPILMDLGVTNPGMLTFRPGVMFMTDAGSAVGMALSATLNKQAGKVTTEVLATAQSSKQTYTINNSLVSAGSIILCTAGKGTNTKQWCCGNVTPGAGSFTVDIQNLDIAAALNGTVVINFLVLS